MPSDVAYTVSDLTYETSVGENDIADISGYPQWANQAVTGVVQAYGRGLAGYFTLPGQINGMWTGGIMTEGELLRFQHGQLHPAFVPPPLRMKWWGFLDNHLDESAASLFANARHAANKKVNLVSIYKPVTSVGGAGRDDNVPSATFGLGVRSLDIFELTQLV